MKNKTSKFSVKTKITAAVLAAICMFSTGAVATTTAYAAEVPANTYSSVSSIDSNSMASDAFFSGASTLISVISKTNPVTAIISSGLFGAFKNFYGSATAKPSPTTQDIADLLDNLSKNVKEYHNQEMNELACISDQVKLQEFASTINKALGYNQNGLTHLATYGDKCSKQDYKNIVKETIGKEGFVNDFTELSNLIINGSSVIKSKPAFEQYLDLSKVCDENNRDYDLIKQDAELLNKSTMEQYALMYTIMMTGYTASYRLQEMKYESGQISKEVMESNQKNILNNMDNQTINCKEVVKKYLHCEDIINNMKVAEVTVNGKTTSKYSFADAWTAAATSSGDAKIKLAKDLKTDDLSSDVDYYKANVNDVFKDGSLYLKAHSPKITIDLNGYSVIHTNNKSYDIYAENSNLEIMDSTNSGKSSISGINTENSTVKISGITIKNSGATGVRNFGGNVTIDNATISGCANSAVVNEYSGTVKITNSTICNNKQTGIYNKSGEVTVEKSTITNNSSNSNGGAFYNQSRLNLINCNVSNNSAQNGGGVYSNTTWTAKGCTFSGNSASNNGGAVCNDYYGSGNTMSNKIENCSFTGNSADNFGGAVYGDSMCYLTIYDTSITGNKAGNQGAGLYAHKGTASSCDPVIGGTVNITGNQLKNGTINNAFLGENSTSKCIFKVYSDKDLSSASKIGVTSNTTDSSLDIVKIWTKASYENAKEVFSSDSSAYHTNRYTHWYSDFYWVEIAK